MKILFLGPPCPPLENHLVITGHSLIQHNAQIDTAFLEQRGIDFCISYKYRYIIRKKEIDWFEGRLINLHISYLPWNRGADPNLWSFLTNTPSGVSIHLIDEGIDTGPILFRQKVEHIPSSATLRSTYESLSDMIVALFIENSAAILSQKIRPFFPQEAGSFHMIADKLPLQSLWEENRWDTPVCKIQGKGVSDA